MSLPNGFLEELRARVSISKVVGRKVTWDQRKSNLAKGDLWAPCPFHQEKTASFHVDDRKGYYYCFGCHAKGDALSFLRETENMGFMEAVEVLAREAGIAMPARDPQAAAAADRQSELAAVMEEAVRHYRLQLKTAAGAAARDYLARRRLGQATLDRFEIGFAPDQRQGLFHALRGKGNAADLIVEAGLCARPEDGGEPYDRFRGRIIYPIRNLRGRCTGLGGRAMDPEARAKYLNSPETPLFDKGRSLYNAGPAREACGKGAPLIVAEGYMDVIALVEAGFAGAVAPLGTAVTEDQLRMLWRIHPEPIVALDGDRAGIAAALRLADLALPLLEAGQGLRFAILPGGQDPDDLIRAEGAGAMARVLEAAQPMVRLIWQREVEGRVLDSPERKATLDKSLRAMIARITDPSIKAHYAAEIKELRYELFGAQRPRAASRTLRKGSRDANGKWTPPPEPPRASTLSSMLAGALGPDGAERLREAMILAICAHHPALVVSFETQLERLALHDPAHDALRHLLLRHCHEPPETVRSLLATQAGGTLERLLALPHVRIAPPVRPDADPDLARMCLAEELAKLAAARAARAEIADAAEDLAGLANEGVTWRLGQAARARHLAEHPKLEEAADMGEDRPAMSAYLQSLLDAQRSRKPES
ncbi:MAG: DNA primase [Phaeovulum sp.]|uniref:DNA primase n=2 Tax=Phaeovulum sp. TaxID=2934796 RepID=UPI00272F029F|nr:DNA primase [Phaeovulum sp.]MDP2063633.1 DNA primase [Phaeovulum sp.]